MPTQFTYDPKLKLGRVMTFCDETGLLSSYVEFTDISFDGYSTPHGLSGCKSCFMPYSVHRQLDSNHWRFATWNVVRNFVDPKSLLEITINDYKTWVSQRTEPIDLVWEYGTVAKMVNILVPFYDESKSSDDMHIFSFYEKPMTRVIHRAPTALS